MRFALRNIHKIENSLGAEFAEKLKKVIKKATKFKELEKDKGYRVIQINEFKFYVVSHLYDVLTLSFKPNE